MASLLFLGFLGLNCFTEFGSNAQVLPDIEVQTLQTVFSKLQHPNASRISQSFCSEISWNYTISDLIESRIACDCSDGNNTICHVTQILIKGHNLTGIIPPELGNLTHLQVMSLLANRLSGPIPPEIGDISTLQDVVLEDNLLGGSLPSNLGNLGRLDRLLLSANNFTGTIPESFGNLKNLTDFRIDGSSLSGQIPNFIGNWTKLSRLDMQGTSMEGPIPSTISDLKNLTELRISDLSGASSAFPNLDGMNTMEELVLRNCLITGSIPAYVGEMALLKTLDLSFNSLTGQIPGTLQGLESLQYLDLSYNNFTSSFQTSCLQSNVNLVSASSSATDSTSVSWCSRKDLPCPQNPNHHSLFINCGGEGMSVNGDDYEEDLSTLGPSNFFSSADKWAYSSTGVYMGNENAYYTVRTSSAVNGLDFYKSARLAPLSLKYYGLCLLEGNYKVQLHFAEIMFSDNQTFVSLGSRLFDISIQGQVVLENFNIMEEAGGVGKGITREFNVDVNGSTLEIHLFWRGKGTTAIPDRGVYGPLISAITVTPNFNVDTGDGLSAGAIAGIVIGSFVILILLLVILRLTGYLGGKDNENDAKLDEEENTHISTKIAGTIGYMAPEYAMRGYLTDKADVYSFGVVLLEIVSGESNTNYRPKEEFVYLLDWAYVQQEQGNLLELVDPSLGSRYSDEEALRMLNLALLCTNPSPTLRPSMSSVVSMMEGKIPVQAPLIKRKDADRNARFRAFEMLSHDSQTNVSIYSHNSLVPRSTSMDGPWIDSSTLIPDETQRQSSSRMLLENPREQT
ncbi:hypothetical protein V6N11_004623 [Hibiscus sabdariffa]|uniref:non-specific serine/threonine protein kinase n=1 Tax=Hibiscus sabdariffa TaxID=183260 RepID=A0ABR2SGN7_9ROSI